MSKEDVSNQNHAERTTQLRKRIKSAKRKENIGKAVFIVGTSGMILLPSEEILIDGVLDLEQGLRLNTLLLSSVLLFLLWFAVFFLGLCTWGNNEHELETARTELAESAR